MYAVGMNVMWPKDFLPAPGELRAEPLELRLVPDEIPVIRKDHRKWLTDQGYVPADDHKALAITPDNGIWLRSGFTSRDEVVRVVSEGCAATTLLPCLLISVDVSTVQFPKLHRVNKIFMPEAEGKLLGADKEVLRRSIEAAIGARWRMDGAGAGMRSLMRRPRPRPPKRPSNRARKSIATAGCTQSETSAWPTDDPVLIGLSGGAGVKERPRTSTSAWTGAGFEQALEARQDGRPNRTAAAREADRDRLLTVPEFCKEYRLSVALFYKLQSLGRAPTVTKVGAKSLISREAAEQWRKQRERN
jgi:hypothetical protein